MEVVNGKLTVYGGRGETVYGGFGWEVGPEQEGTETSIEELNEDGESWSLMDSKLKHWFYHGVSVVVPSTKPN